MKDKQTDGQTDRQTDRQTEPTAIAAVHSVGMGRVGNNDIIGFTCKLLASASDSGSVGLVRNKLKKYRLNNECNFFFNYKHNSVRIHRDVH